MKRKLYSLIFFVIIAASITFSCRHPFNSPADPDGERFLGKLTVYPLDGVTVPVLTPYISWDEVEGADSYIVQYSDNEDTLPDAEEIEVNELGYLIENPLDTETTYYYRVRPVDEDGGKGISSSGSFNVADNYTVEGINEALGYCGLNTRLVKIVEYGEEDSFTFTDEWGWENTLTAESFGLSEAEITQGDYEKLIGELPELTAGEGSDYPIYNITLDESIDFCNRISQVIGLQPVFIWVKEHWEAGEFYAGQYESDISNLGFYVPNEDQWSFASGGSEHYSYPLGDTFIPDDYIFNTDSSKPVKSLEPNSFGLYDMGGNVAERVYDTGFYSGHTSWSGTFTKGGDWKSDTSRNWAFWEASSDDPEKKYETKGFRIAVGGFGKW